VVGTGLDPWRDRETILAERPCDVDRDIALESTLLGVAAVGGEELRVEGFLRGRPCTIVLIVAQRSRLDTLPRCPVAAQREPKLPVDQGHALVGDLTVAGIA